MIKEFNQQKDYQKTYITTKFVVKFKYYGKEQKKNNYKCPKIRINVQTTKRSFSSDLNYKRKIEKVECTDPPTENAEIYATNTPTKIREK